MELDDDGAREWDDSTGDWREDSGCLVCLMSAFVYAAICGYPTRNIEWWAEYIDTPQSGKYRP